MRRLTKKYRHALFAAAGILVVVGSIAGAVFWQQRHTQVAEADSVASSLTSVYQGALQIFAAGAGADGLVVGAGGSVISGTGQIFLRPNDSLAASYIRGVANKQEQGLYLDARQWDTIAITLQNNSSTQHTLAAVAEGTSTTAAILKGDLRIQGDLLKGDLQAVVPTSQGDLPLHAIEAPDARFVDYGTAETKNGSAYITIDPAFAETVDLTSYMVFVSPQGTTAALAVAEQTLEGFTIRTSEDTSFVYKIIAMRRGYEEKRFRQ